MAFFTKINHQDIKVQEVFLKGLGFKRISTFPNGDPVYWRRIVNPIFTGLKLFVKDERIYIEAIDSDRFPCYPAYDIPYSEKNVLKILVELNHNKKTR